MRDDRRLGLGRPFGAPGLVQRIDRHGLQFGPRLGGGGAQTVEGVGTVQARIEADRLAFGRRTFQVGGDTALHQVADFEKPLVDLVADLEGIAAIHEHGGLVLEDHRRPGGAGEAGRPGQPVVGRGQVFVLVLVLVRHEEAVQPLLGHGLADQGKVLGPERGIGVFVEALAHVED